MSSIAATGSPSATGRRRTTDRSVESGASSPRTSIWTALREFRKEEVQTWDGWPREVFWVSVTHPSIIQGATDPGTKARVSRRTGEGSDQEADDVNAKDRASGDG